MGEMDIPNPHAAAIERAIDLAGGKTALMRKLNERGHDIKSHNVITQWVENGVPSHYCPDIEALTGVLCEDLNSKTNWAVLRKEPARHDVEPANGTGAKPDHAKAAKKTPREKRDDRRDSRKGDGRKGDKPSNRKGR